MRTSMCADDILDLVCYGENGKPRYLMTNDENELKICEELEKDGLLICVHKINPRAINAYYSYVSNDEKGREIANSMIREDL